MTDERFITACSSEEAERAVLGSILLEPDATLFYCGRMGITKDHFYTPWHATLFTILQDMRKAGRPVDLMTVTDYVRTKGLVEQVHGEEYLERLIDCTPTAAHAEYYLTIIRNKHAAKQILLGTSTAKEKVLGGQDPTEAVAVLHTLLTSLHERRVGTQNIRLVADEAEQEWLDARDRGFVGIPSLWPELTKITGGYRSGEVTVIGAYRGEGKSMVMSNEALDKALHNVPTLIVSLEMTRRAIIKRILGDLGNFSTFKMDIGKGDDRDYAAAGQAKKVLDGLPLYIEDAFRTDADIAATITHYVAAKGVKFIWVDHMQLIKPAKPSGNEVTDMKNISNDLSALAKRLDVPIVILSQYSRNSEMNDEVPKLSSLKGSGAIEEDARCIILMYRDKARKEVKPPRAIWEVAKNNNGGTGELKMVRVGNRQRWRQESTYIEGQNGDPPVFRETGGRAN